MVKYATLYERLVANTVLQHEDNPQSCWLWTGHVHKNGYPRLSVRTPGRPNPHGKAAHRAMLEEVLDCTFPFDEAGHLCGNPECVNPDHLEVQTRSHNMADQRSQFGTARIHVNTERSWIPVLYPRGAHA